MTRRKPGGCHEYRFQHQTGGGTGCYTDRPPRERSGGSRGQDRAARDPKCHGGGYQRASVSRQIVVDRAAASIVYQVVDLKTSQVVEQFPDEAILRRRAYFHTLDLTKGEPTRLLATDRKA